MINERTKFKRNPTKAGLLLGSLLGAAVLILAAAVLAGGSGNALKPVVAVWLAALPVVGFGALCGWLVAFVLAMSGRGHTPGRQEE